MELQYGGEPLGLDVPSNLYGPDTEELLRRIATMENGVLNVSNLQIHSLPELPAGLKQLYCGETQISALPELPTGLTHLHCGRTQITVLPELPTTLVDLGCSFTSIKTLPELPKTLRHLSISHTQISELPELPEGVNTLYIGNTPLQQIIPYQPGDGVQGYNLRWKAWREEEARKLEEAISMERSQQRCREIKESLMMEMWHPRRVEKLIEMGGFELLESF